MRRTFLTIEEAATWASSYLGRQVTTSNISYLIQYGKIRKYDERGNLKRGSNGATKVSLSELKRYYDSNIRERSWKEHLGEDINWHLSFEKLRESERTKHVHRLHPYKGKFIPQLVEYFLDSHTDDSKKVVFFHEADTILDPFMGSGTTLVQCLELGLHSIGVDVSRFNCMISGVKVKRYDLDKLSQELLKAAKATEGFSASRFRHEHHTDVGQLCSSFNEKYYPTPEFKVLTHRIREFQRRIQIEKDTQSEGDEEKGGEKVEQSIAHHKDEALRLEEDIVAFTRRNSAPVRLRIDPDNVGNLANEFTGRYSEIMLERLNKRIKNIVRQRQTGLSAASIEPFADTPFLSSWFTEQQRLEMQHYLDQIDHQSDPEIQNVMRIVLSRTARSCRATTHADLATLVRPQTGPYYCTKHFKICRPVGTIVRHLRRYTKDTTRRIKEFSQLRKDAFCEVINDDSRTADLFNCIAEKNKNFYDLLKKRKIDGIFTSPPYVGQIDYHEQHAYAYELFGIDRKDELEIGRKSNGTSRRAQSEYVNGISAVLLNAERFLKKDPHIFIVANDSKDLYPKIAEASGLRIDGVFKRPVLNRTERDKQPYSESIFHMVPD